MLLSFRLSPVLYGGWIHEPWELTEAEARGLFFVAQQMEEEPVPVNCMLNARES